MSYNTRRSYSSAPQNAQQSSAVGQRRPIGSNFVSGGQLPNTQQQQQRGAQQTGINFKNQQQSQQTYQQQSYSTQPPVKQEPVKPTPPPTPAPIQNIVKVQQNIPKKDVPIQGANPPAPEAMEGGEDDGTKKKFWFKNKGKISKAERVRRRNARLSKILQPKNAVMILNELVKGCQYSIDDSSLKVETNQFKASVQFDGHEFNGTGRTKVGAKNAAAEVALKYLIKTKQFKLKQEEDDGEGADEKMEIEETDNNQVLPWSHIASFAMYKLFTSWGEDPTTAIKQAQESQTPGQDGALSVGAPLKMDARPSRKMPDNPETVNPLMMMNQMLPHAEWEELPKVGTTPAVFSFKVTVDGKSFTGTGSSKKVAKKMAAYAACHHVLNILYPADVWSPL